MDPASLFFHKDVILQGKGNYGHKYCKKLNVYENVFTQLILVAATQIGIPN